MNEYPYSLPGKISKEIIVRQKESVGNANDIGLYGLSNNLHTSFIENNAAYVGYYMDSLLRSEGTVPSFSMLNSNITIT